MKTPLVDPHANINKVTAVESTNYKQFSNSIGSSTRISCADEDNKKENDNDDDRRSINTEPSKIYLQFRSAKAWARRQNLPKSTHLCWNEYYLKHHTLPTNIPFNPSIVYKNAGWCSWRDFLGDRRKKLATQRRLEEIRLQKEHIHQHHQNQPRVPQPELPTTTTSQQQHDPRDYDEYCNNGMNYFIEGCSGDNYVINQSSNVIKYKKLPIVEQILPILPSLHYIVSSVQTIQLRNIHMFKFNYAIKK